MCGLQRSRPNRRPTATRTPSLSMQRPQEAIGRAVSQSPEWGKHAAAILARSTGLLMEAKINILSFFTEGLSQAPGRGSMAECRDVLPSPPQSRHLGQWCIWSRWRTEVPECTQLKTNRQKKPAMTFVSSPDHRLKLGVKPASIDVYSN